MWVGPDRGLSSEINITPMIDVLLVLLVLFMVIQPVLQKGLDLQVPPLERDLQIANLGQEFRDQIILSVRLVAGGEPGVSYAINKQPVSSSELGARIRQIFAERRRKVLFVEGGERVRYAEVIRAVDIAREAGVEVVGLVPREGAIGAELSDDRALR